MISIHSSRMATARSRRRPDEVTTQATRHETRRGSILVLATFCIMAVLAFTAFSVDVGIITLTRTGLQNASDAAALGGALEMYDGLMGGVPPAQVQSLAGTAAASVAAGNPHFGEAATFISPTSDLQFGRRTYNSVTGTWDIAWGVSPFNAVSVVARRDGTSGSQSRLPLFFARAIGQQDAELQTTSTAALIQAVGVRVDPSSTLTSGILPIAYDEPSWNALLAGTGSDTFSYSAQNGTVSCGSDGIKEIDLYPYGNQALTPGNRGTVKIGVTNNSTAELQRQILHGLSASDLASFPNSTLRVDQGSLTLPANPGLSAAIKSSLEAIIGQPRAIPIFRSVSGNGNNTNYEIVKFVGIRILDVRLTGGNKRVVAQPAVYTDSTLISGQSSTATDYMFLPPRLVK